MALNEAWAPAVKGVVDLLVRREFALLEADGRSGRLTAQELAQALDGYGRTLVEIPEAGWELAQTYEIQGPAVSWAIDLPLWTLEEGRSDLTLSLCVRRTNDEKPIVVIDDLHVL